MDLASKYLDVIRYQQTFTSGWSGSVRATVGVAEGSAGLTGGASYVQQSLSLPEIVHHFERLVTSVSQEGPVIIGIDELDKIGSADRAQAFLNDIKSVFGIDQCYFLVSVSEDALANFERRGLPLRDAFDSALDDVVLVNPLDYPSSLKLIRGRVVGLSEPYAALAYCLSGGLPRDMIRWVRTFIVNGEDHGFDLSEIAAAVLADDVKRKAWASMLELTRHSGNGNAEAVRLVGQLKISADPEWLLAQCEERLALFCREPRENSSVDGSVTLNEIAAYFYFIATIRQIFISDLNAHDFEGLARDAPVGTFYQLALARQLFASDLYAAIREISLFRAANGMGRELSIAT